MVDQHDREDREVHEVARAEEREREQQLAVTEIRPHVARDRESRAARGRCGGTVVTDREEREGARKSEQRRGGEDPLCGHDVDEGSGDRRGRDPGDRRSDAHVAHRERALAVG